MTHSTSLPQLYLVTPEPPADRPFAEFIGRLERALETGIRLVQLRAKTLTAPQYVELAEQAYACCRRHDARMLLNAPADMAGSVQADGIHLTSTPTRSIMSCCEKRYTNLPAACNCKVLPLAP